MLAAFKLGGGFSEVVALQLFMASHEHVPRMPLEDDCFTMHAPPTRHNKMLSGVRSVRCPSSEFLSFSLDSSRCRRNVGICRCHTVIMACWIC